MIGQQHGRGKLAPDDELFDYGDDYDEEDYGGES